VAKRLGIGHSVYWLGYQRAEDVMSALDIFTLPSRYEGMPYVLLEALAAGLPIVSTLVGGTSVAVDMDGNGTIVPTHEPKDFADALCPLIGSSELRQRFARASRVKSRRLTTDIMVDKTCAIYRELVPGEDEHFPLVTPHTIPGMWPDFEEQENVYGLGNPV
jgi:glycosyltransferase involved in cell wall biosynthesis